MWRGFHPACSCSRLRTFAVFCYAPPSMTTPGSQMQYTMDITLGSEKSKVTKHTSTGSTLQTPPRTPNLNATSCQTLASEIRNIYHALTELPDLAPGKEVNALLTRLVSLCVVPYSHDFIAYFFNIEGIYPLCERLRPLCAMAEGELELFWAKKIVEDSFESKGMFPPSSKDLIIDGHMILRTGHSKPLSDTIFAQHLPVLPKLSGPLPH